MLGQGGRAGLSLRILPLGIMDPRQFGLTPGSIRCSGKQIQEEMSRNTQTPGNGHLARTTGCFLQSITWGKVGVSLPRGPGIRDAPTGPEALHLWDGAGL